MRVTVNDKFASSQTSLKPSIPGQRSLADVAFIGNTLYELGSGGGGCSHGRPEPSRTSRMMRPGPVAMGTTRSPRHTASRTLWVTDTTVLRLSCQMRWMSS